MNVAAVGRRPPTPGSGPPTASLTCSPWLCPAHLEDTGWGANRGACLGHPPALPGPCWIGDFRSSPRPHPLYVQQGTPSRVVHVLTVLHWPSPEASPGPVPLDTSSCSPSCTVQVWAVGSGHRASAWDGLSAWKTLTSPPPALYADASPPIQPIPHGPFREPPRPVPRIWIQGHLVGTARHHLVTLHCLLPSPHRELLGTEHCSYSILLPRHPSVIFPATLECHSPLQMGHLLF